MTIELQQQRMKIRDQITVFQQKLAQDPVVKRYTLILESPLVLLVGISGITVVYTIIFTLLFPGLGNFFEPGNLIVTMILATASWTPILLILARRLNNRKTKLLDDTLLPSIIAKLVTEDRDLISQQLSTTVETMRVPSEKSIQSLLLFDSNQAV